MGQIARCFYHFFMIVVVTRYKTKATARRALTFIVRIFVNDTIAIAVWTSFHVRSTRGIARRSAEKQNAYSNSLVRRQLP